MERFHFNDDLLYIYLNTGTKIVYINLSVTIYFGNKNIQKQPNGTCKEMIKAFGILLIIFIDVFGKVKSIIWSDWYCTGI